MDEDDYEIGYGKPPRHTRFKPGRSGNPRGRPKGAKNLKIELIEELNERINIKESGKSKKVSKQRAMLKTMTARAVQGDTKAATVIVNLVFRLLHDEPQAHEDVDLTPADEAILQRFAEQILNDARRHEDDDT